MEEKVKETIAIMCILKELRDKTALDMLTFDVKDEENIWGAYSDTYMENASKRMSGCEWQDMGWDKMTPWQKMCVYKVSDKAGVDCDVALRSVVIYWLAFGLDQEWKIESQKEEQYQLMSAGKNWVLRGDTMNSYATTVREKLRKFRDTGNNLATMREMEIIKQENECLEDKYPNKNYWEAAVLEHYDYFKPVLSSCAEQFISLVHTLGNFIPVPFGKEEPGEFNRPRARQDSPKVKSENTKKPNDYWDLALACIYNYYMREGTPIKKRDGEEYTLEWLLGETTCEEKKCNTKLCEKWLKTFESQDGSQSWNTFVERNFLQDFVNQIEGGSYGKPKELWKGHFAGNAIPTEPQQFEQFFTNASAWILARGNRIAVAIKEKLEGKSGQELENLAKQMIGEPI